VRGLEAGGSDAQLAWLDRSGRELEMVGSPANVRGLDLSLDGRRIALHIDDAPGRVDIWVMDVERGTTSRLTFDPERHNASPVWTPDGQHVLYSTFRPRSTIHEKAASGGEAREVHISRGSQSLPWGASMDGTLILGEGGGGQRADIFRMPLTGGPPSAVVATNAWEGFGQLSPDGRWLAFGSDESGRREVFIQSFPVPGTKLQVSTTGGVRPRWRGDGRELYYRSTGSGTPLRRWQSKPMVRV